MDDGAAHCIGFVRAAKAFEAFTADGESIAASMGANVIAIEVVAKERINVRVVGRLSTSVSSLGTKVMELSDNQGIDGEEREGDARPDSGRGDVAH